MRRVFAGYANEHLQAACKLFPYGHVIVEMLEMLRLQPWLQELSLAAWAKPAIELKRSFGMREDNDFLPAAVKLRPNS